ncbi:TldD/PmbA family protein [Aureimonas populi]|uniref:TldD/PmbA family protein n=1 Tax=Aureimonas populi TaxID=1701758 RepID=A0ABW5CKZ3_9HYPH|nr:TldD/PmbA family protein [Aureimonas populi]
MEQDTARLLDVAGRLIETARRHGAEGADAAVVISRSRAASVRLGQVEEVEASESADLSLRVFVEGRVAGVSADIAVDLDRLVERAVAMARVSPPDPFAGLADSSLLARNILDLDLFDASSEPSGEDLVRDALVLEEAARAVPGVTNSGGASASAGFTGLVLATSGGFSGERRRSGFSRSVSVVAGQGTGMQRDYDFDAAIHLADLEAPRDIGRRAGERAVRRLDPRVPETGRYPIVFDPRISRGLFGHLVAGLSGAAIARGTSFLKDRMGEPILPEGVDVADEPLLPRRAGSRPFDGEGVAGGRLALVEGGVLANWLLDSTSAREIGLATNGRAQRSSAGTTPGISNVVVSAGQLSPEALIAEAGEGIYVTELIGHGADLVTGDYSRGASGFLIKNGRLGDPVSEFTIAGNLREMFLGLTLADDLDTRHRIVAPTVRLEAMTVAGRRP